MVQMEQILLFFYDKYKGEWNDIYVAIATKERVDPIEVQEVWNKYSEKHRIVTMLSEDYPEEYKKDYYKPPFVLLYDKI